MGTAGLQHRRGPAGARLTRFARRRHEAD